MSELSGLHWAHPLWLLATLPLLMTTFALLRRERQAALLYSSSQLLEGLPTTTAQRVKRLLPWLRFAGLLLVVLALMRPRQGLTEFRIHSEGVAIVMCIDRSGSMQALDFEMDGRRVDRLEVVKRVFRDFVMGRGRLPGRPDDQIGLISFGGFAEAKAPLTLDHGVLLDVLNSIQVAQPIYDQYGRVANAHYLEEERATAIGDAVTLAVDRLKDAEATSKVIILLSDGENNAGVVSPEQAAEAAKTLGIKIYSIGVGSTGRAPFRLLDPFGRERLVAQPVHLDEEELKLLAKTTDGRYFNAQDTDALEHVCAEIDQLEKTPSEGRLYTEYRELFQWLLLPGLALVVLEIGLRCTRFRSLP